MQFIISDNKCWESKNEAITLPHFLCKYLNNARQINL